MGIFVQLSEHEVASVLKVVSKMITAYFAKSSVVIIIFRLCRQKELSYIPRTITGSAFILSFE